MKSTELWYYSNMMVKPELKLLPVEQLVRGKFQPRRQFAMEELQELADSIRSSGLIQPIVVRPLSELRYEIIAGERRWRAAQLAGLTEVTCLLKSYSDEQAATVATIENVNRVNLNPIEEAQAYARLIDEFGYVHDEVAAVVGKPRSKVTNSLRLLKLAESVQELLKQNKLSEGHGKVLAGTPPHLQHRLAQQASEQAWSVRQLENAVKKSQQSAVASRDQADLQALSRALADHVGSQVSIDFDGNKGRLQIDFHNLDILQGLFAKMGFRYHSE